MDSSQQPMCVYASYPKTGSAFLIDLIRRWSGIANDGATAEFFQWGKSKSNFVIRSGDAPRVMCLKTHHAFGRFQRALRKAPPALAPSIPVTDKATDAFKLVYVRRNPFAVLLSAIKYSKNLLDRPGTLDAWIADGTAQAYFIDMLSLRSIPSIESFEAFSLLDQDDRLLESTVWRYVESGGSIPFLERNGGPTYFDHVKSYSFALDDHHALTFTYEELMNRDATVIRAIADFFKLDCDDLLSAWDAEAADRSAAVGKYADKRGFYGDYRQATPERIRNLSSWPELRKHVQLACPALASLVD